MVGNKVKFAYIATGSSLPETYPDADTIYFLEEAKEIRVGNRTLGNVDDLAIHPDQLAETLEAWTVKSIEFVGSGDYVSNITYDDSTGRVTVTKSTLPVLSKGAAPAPAEVTLQPGGSFTVVTDTSVSGHTITDNSTKFTLPDFLNYEAGPGINIEGSTISLPQIFYDYLVEHTFAVPVINELSISNLGTEAEIGTSVTVTSFSHRETNIQSIEGTLTLRHGSSVVKTGVNPVTSTTSVAFEGSGVVVTRTTPGNDTFTLSGIDKLGNSITKSLSKSFYIPKFLGADPDASITSTEVLAMSRAKTIPNTITISETSYIYFVTDETINSVKDADTGFAVPIESPVNLTVDINSVPTVYHVYRSSERIIAGTYNFTIS